MDSAAFGLDPPEGTQNRRQPLISDHFPLELQTGRIALRSEVKKYSATDGAVVFEDGQKEYAIDCIIYDTGYKLDLPFDDHPEDAMRMKLYKHIFPGEFLPKQSLALVGAIRTVDGGDSLSLPEMQCRYICGVLSGQVKVPDLNQMRRETELREKQSDLHQEPHFPQIVDWTSYMDELAEEIGVKPLSIYMSLYGIPTIDFNVVWDPVLPYQFRFRGMHCWAGAKEAIRNFRKRVSLVKNIKREKGVVRARSDWAGKAGAGGAEKEEVPCDLEESARREFSHTIVSLGLAILTILKMVCLNWIPQGTRDLKPRKMAAAAASLLFLSLFLFRLYYNS